MSDDSSKNPVPDERFTAQPNNQPAPGNGKSDELKILFRLESVAFSK